MRIGVTEIKRPGRDTAEREPVVKNSPRSPLTKKKPKKKGST